MSPTMVMPIGWTAPAPSPWTTRNTIRLVMLQARPHIREPVRNSAIPTSITGLRPMRSATFPYIGTETACASRYAENSHGNWVKPPRSPTIAGTAVARMVASMATRPMLSITASRIGPRSLRRPTLARVISVDVT